ncbi:MAG: TolC family protein [Desulfobacterota bacterium]|nr:TolC family protein [Thermodesulfobacteriota bacterium]
MYRYIRIIVVIFCSTVPVWAYADNATQPLSLERAITIALTNNPTFQTAGLAVARAEHRRKAAEADFLPKLGTSYTYTRLNEAPRIKAPAGSLYSEKINTVIGTQNSYQWDIHMIQPIFTGGQLYSIYKLEAFGVDVAKLQHETARQELMYNVKAAYFNVLKAQKLRDVARQAVAQIAAHEKTANDFFAQDMIAKNDLLEAQVRLAQAQQDLVRTEEALALARAVFNTVLHQDVNTDVEILDVSDEQKLELALVDSQARALQCQPVIQEIDTRIKQAQTAVQLAQSTYFPKIFLVSSYLRQGNQADLRGTPYKDPEAWHVSVNLDWTFWEWGRKQHIVGEQNVKLLEAQEMRKEIVDKVMLRVKDAWLRCEEHWKNIGVARTAIARAEENFRIYENRFAQQMATTTDVLDAQTLLTQAYSNYFAARYDYCIARAALEYAIGADLTK